MKRVFLCAGLLTGLLCAPALPAAQDSATAAAEREEAETRFKNVETRIEKLEETLQLQQKKINSLLEEIHSLREENDRLKNRNENAAIQENIKHLAEKLEEVDRKRVADNKLALSQLEALTKGLTKPVAPKETTLGSPKPEKSGATNGNSPPEKGYTYKIKDGDTLLRIVTELRAQGYKITQKQVMDANAGVNWNRLKIGQTVFIPSPTL